MPDGRGGLHDALDALDRLYRRWHHLEAVGPLFFVGKSQYQGIERRFADGTALRPGDPLGLLHFNNARIATLGLESGRHGTAWRFTRLLRESLDALSAYSVTSAGRPIEVYQGTTWMQVHGLKVGFTIEPLPDGWRSRLLRLHFRLLRAGFAPATFRRSAGPPVPRRFWITRGDLQKHFGKLS